jgi:hypothetical protein
MGDDLSLYRARVGMFHLQAMRACNVQGSSYAHGIKSTADSVWTVCVYVFVVVAAFAACCGDIESNPGPKPENTYCSACHCRKSEKPTVAFFRFPLDM